LIKSIFQFVGRLKKRYLITLP